MIWRCHPGDPIQTNTYALAALEVYNLPEGEISLGIEGSGNTPVWPDGFALVKKTEVTEVKDYEDQLNPVPKQMGAGFPNGIIMIITIIRLSVMEKPFRYRKYLMDCLLLPSIWAIKTTTCLGWSWLRSSEFW